jgi:WD40 repeat protein
MSSLFVSYNRADAVKVSQLCDWLTTRGYDSLFLDFDPERGVPAGTKWEAELYAQLRRADAVLFVSSAASATSRWCFAELAMARSLGKRIIPVGVDGGATHELLGDTQAIDLSGAEHHGRPHRGRVAPIGRRRGRPVERAGPSFDKLALERLDQSLRAADLDPERTLTWDPQRSPFPGLGSFEERDAGVFFGRQPEIEQLLELLHASRHRYTGRLLAVLGPSGSGKSSLVRAGLVPRLRRARRPWLVLPTLLPGGQPVRQLALVLADAYQMISKPRSLEEIERMLGAGPDGLVRVVEELRHLSPRDTPPAVLLFVDQAEELLTSAGPEEGERFLALLHGATRAEGHLWTVLTLRSEFLSAFLQTQRDARSFDEQLLVGPLQRSRLAEVIERPAERAGLSLAPGLVGRMVEDTGGGDALPLLAYTLGELYERSRRRRDATITGEDYEDLGGVVGALQHAADDEQRHLGERGLGEVVLPTLLRFVAIGAEGQPTRRRLPRVALNDQETKVVEAFIEARLLTSSQIEQKPVVEIAHEALLRQWPPLSQAIEAQHQQLRQRSELERAAHDWERNQRASDYLLTGERLEAARRLRNSRGVTLGEPTALEDEFLNSSIQQQERQQAEQERQQAEQQAARRRRIRLAFAGLAVALVVVVYLYLQAAHERDLAVSRELAASSTSQLSVDPELSVLLASAAMGHAHTAEAEQALERAVADYRPFTVLSGHKGPVFGAVFSPDERWALTAGADGTARLFDAASGRTLAIMRGDGRALNGPAFSPDGQLAVAGGEDGTARVWQVPSGRSVAVLRGPTALVRAPAFSHDGRLIVAASDDGTARVWRARTGRQLSVLKGHKGPVQSAAFSPTARDVVTAGSDGIARVWETATGRTVAVLRGHKDNLLHSASFSSNGRLVVTASRDGTARVWSAATGEPQAVLQGHGTPVDVAAFSPDAKYVVTGGEDATARIWDTATGDEVRVLRGHTAPVGTAIFSRDGRSILTAGEDRSARVWDPETGEEVAILRGHKDAVLDAALNRDATGVLTSSGDGTARVWHTSPSEAVTVLRGHGDEVGSAAFSPDRRRVVTASFDNTARIWDASTGEMLLVLRGHTAPVRSAAFSPDGDRIVTASEDGSARVWDAASGRTVLVLKGHEGKVKSAVFSSDGQRLLTAGADRTARIWDATSGRSLRVLRGHSEEVEAAVFGRQDQLVATASEDNTARLWRAATGKRIATLQGHTDQLEGIAFSGDGRRLVTASSDDTARIWDVATRRTVMVLVGHDGDVESADFSLDNRFVATASDDKTARVWDAATARQIVIFRGHETDLESAAFSRDARFIATASEDRTARIYRCELCVSVDDMLALAHRRMPRRLTPSEKARFHA